MMGQLASSETVSLGLARPRAAAPKWTEAEDDRLRAAYAKGERIDLVAAELGRPVRGTMSRTRKIGLAGTHPLHGGWCSAPLWTTAEDARLREAFGTTRASILAQELGRSKVSIYNRAFALGLKSSYTRPPTGRERYALRIAFDRGLALPDVASAMGRRLVSLSKYAVAHGYRFGRRRLLSQPITIDEIIALADPATELPPMKVYRRACRARTPRERGPSLDDPARLSGPTKATLRAVQPASRPKEPASPAPSVLRPPAVSAAPVARASWIERQMAELVEARRFLETKGFSVVQDRASPIGRWFLSGWRWPLSNQELIETARRARAQEAA